MENFRIFVSSPADVGHERRRVDRVVERLNGEFAGIARLEAIRWETEFYQAHATFQAQIPASADCDIVVAIFRGRLGTALPPDFERLPDGSAYPSGTAYEVLTAMAARRENPFPDIFVFRHTEPPSVRLDDDQARGGADFGCPGSTGVATVRPAPRTSAGGTCGPPPTGCPPGLPT